MDLPAGGGPVDFQVHRSRLGVEGGRAAFERMVTSLVDRLHGPAHGVAPIQGDRGVDVFLGDLTSQVRIWQVRYVIDRLAADQLRNVEHSFARACRAARENGYGIESWVLCVPVSLPPEARRRWTAWRDGRQRETNIAIELWDETRLRSLLMRPDTDDIRRAYYDDDVQAERRTSTGERQPATGETQPATGEVRPVAGTGEGWPSTGGRRLPTGQPRLRARHDDEALDATDPAAGRWYGGAEVRLGHACYLLHDPVTETVAPDRSWAQYDADARELVPTARPVRIRHLQVHRPTAEAEARRNGLRAQADLLDQFAGAAGLPRTLTRHGLAGNGDDSGSGSGSDNGEGSGPGPGPGPGRGQEHEYEQEHRYRQALTRCDTATLVLSAPTGRSWRDVHTPGSSLSRLSRSAVSRGGPARTRPVPGGFGVRGFGAGGPVGGLDRIAAAGALAAAAELCLVLQTLHQQGQAHRCLTLDAIVITAPGRGRRAVALRDLGLLGLTEVPGEGGPWQAPEQRHQGLGRWHHSVPAGGSLAPRPIRGLGARPGPPADVHQVAALVRETLGGLASAPDVPLPGHSAEFNDLLARALHPDPARRPPVGALAVGLRAERQRLSLGGRP
ncbi:hypothetical protein Ga0074812_12959 [Parafrankia irregularis]|uniref:Protein kinase domain-containing protein n=1 Tax=Parafrankia irregularis TaxID=795642 RepID=A0A0S4QVF2_9ACTN|nr:MULTISPECIES: hypothetical protein [Parafrankia]MBE3202487.1 hypothetical protein [Parafrankia sp. CH37]CUU59589.1 hypothetical protein Ga0074812_12959 [Parafrankia irregularis]